MSPALTIIMGILNGAFNLLANHLGKPPGWRPTAEQWDDLDKEVSEATPDAVRAAARARLLAAGIELPSNPV